MADLPEVSLLCVKIRIRDEVEVVVSSCLDCCSSGSEFFIYVRCEVAIDRFLYLLQGFRDLFLCAGVDQDREVWSPGPDPGQLLQEFAPALTYDAYFLRMLSWPVSLNSERT